MQARRAEANFARAKSTLLDLAWIVEESALWRPESEAFAESVGDKLDEYVAMGKSSVNRTLPNDPINAARLSFDARRAAMSGKLEAAHHMFRMALDAWRELAADHPDKETYRRAMSLCLYSFSQLERDRPLSVGEADPQERLHNFYRNVAKDPRIRGWSLKDYARLLLARGDMLFKVGRTVDAAKAFEIGAIATSILFETAPHDAETLCLRGQLSIRLAKERRRLGLAESAAELVNLCKNRLSERSTSRHPTRPAVESWRTLIVSSALGIAIERTAKAKNCCCEPRGYTRACFRKIRRISNCSTRPDDAIATWHTRDCRLAKTRRHWPVLRADASCGIRYTTAPSPFLQLTEWLWVVHAIKKENSRKH